MNSTFGAPWPRPGRYRRGPTAWPTDRESRIRWLEEHQRDLEQRAADVADRVRRLREHPSGPDRAEGHRSEPRPRRSRAAAEGRFPGRAGRGWSTWGPGVARAREVELGEGRQLAVRELAGPPDAPTLLLLHGWGGTAAGNWATALPALARHFHVVAPDLPGHDRETVDDLSVLIDRLDLGSVIAVGYSLGSAVAYQLWRQNPEQVDGLVLCAPAGVSALVPAAAPAPPAAPDLPIAVVVTEQDRLIPAQRQLELARSLPGATVWRVNGNHFAFARYGVFVPTLLEACQSVADRSLSGGIVV